MCHTDKHEDIRCPACLPAACDPQTQPALNTLTLMDVYFLLRPCSSGRLLSSPSGVRQSRGFTRQLTLSHELHTKAREQRLLKRTAAACGKHSQTLGALRATKALTLHQAVLVKATRKIPDDLRTTAESQTLYISGQIHCSLLWLVLVRAHDLSGPPAPSPLCH